MFNKQSFCVTLIFGLILYGKVTAHEINTSYTIIELREQEIVCSFFFDQTDLQRIFELDENADDVVTRDELLVNMDSFCDYFAQRIVLRAGGEAIDFGKVTGHLFEDDAGNIFVQIDVRQTLDHQPWKVTLKLDVFDDLSTRHKNLAKFVYGEEIQQTIFITGYNEQTISFEGTGASIVKQIKQFTWLGTEHIFIGYDHILFLMGLIILGDSIKNLIKIVSSFTLAHSITLILATLQIVTIPARLVESVIALSIVYIAFENFFIKNSNQRWLITFIFGLMHGFGFANVLTELGLPGKALAASLISFNIGVELGQIAIILVIFPIILLLTNTKWKNQFVYGLSSLILLFGVFWFVERVFGLRLWFG